MKLFELYNFNDTKCSAPGKREETVHGIWMIESVRNLDDPPHRTWSIRRVATFNNRYPIGEQREFPDILFRLFGNKVERQHLVGEPITHKTTEVSETKA